MIKQEILRIFFGRPI